MIQVLLLKNNTILITRIEEVGSELGEPDCKLIQPFELILNPITEEHTLKNWPYFTAQKEIMIHSDSILTIVDPSKEQLDKYQAITAE